mmetsp:Transcript_11517/g.48364  ORF Transcript_11517/g.48364 Transcript_11517/m.48364 type:complete len:214 (+) Transcript_11517:1922-2563(+)
MLADMSMPSTLGGTAMASGSCSRPSRMVLAPSACACACASVHPLPVSASASASCVSPAAASKANRRASCPGDARAHASSNSTRASTRGTACAGSRVARRTRANTRPLTPTAADLAPPRITHRSEGARASTPPPARRALVAVSSSAPVVWSAAPSPPCSLAVAASLSFSIDSSPVQAAEPAEWKLSAMPDMADWASRLPCMLPYTLPCMLLRTP